MPAPPGCGLPPDLAPAPFHAAEADAPAQAAAVWLRAADGVQLRAALLARGTQGTVLLFPGRTEVVEKYGRVARDLATAGLGVLTLDWRGQGLSDRQVPDPLLGHVDSFAEFQHDVVALTGAARAMDLPRPWLLLAHSMGGCIGLRALLLGLPVQAAAFSAPMWGLPLGRMQRAAVRALALLPRGRARRMRAVPGPQTDFTLADMPFDDNLLTSDRAQFDYMQAQVRAHPALALAAPTMGWLAAALGEMAALRRRPSPDLPALAMVGSREKIVLPQAIAERIARWPGGRFEELAGAEHELMLEAPAPRGRFLDAAIGLIRNARP